MRYSYVEVTSFKSIKKVRLDFDAHPRSKVYTLIGLNESGKTTILEAINLLSTKVDFAQSLNMPGYTAMDYYDFIPINKRLNFNEEIKTEAGVVFDENDKMILTKYVMDKFGFDLVECRMNTMIRYSMIFENSDINMEKSTRTWAMYLRGRYKNKKKVISMSAFESRSAVNYMVSYLPQILYFPNFLFEFPDKIYLEDVDFETEKHRLYREVMQDVLQSVDKSMTIETHLLSRLKDVSRINQRTIESILLGMGKDMSDKVFKNWNRIFKRKMSNKEIIVDSGHDDLGWYLQLRLRDGMGIYTVSERSLGFRWFFAFLLLTHYRQYRQLPN